VKYLIRGCEVYDISPEFVFDLESIASSVFCVQPHFSDFNSYEESVMIMHASNKEDGPWPESPWLKTRFRFDQGTKIDNLQGVLFKSPENQETYVKLAEKIPKSAEKAIKKNYDSKWIDRLNHQHVRGKSLVKMVLDRGKEYDTMALTFKGNTEVVFLYNPGTFVGFEFEESTGHGIKSTHYILADVDPSKYVAGFAESASSKEDVLFNEGLEGGKVKALLANTKVSYKEPEREAVEPVPAKRGDQYVVVFQEESPKKAQEILAGFKDSFEDKLVAGSQAHLDGKSIAKQLGPSFSSHDLPTFAVDMSKDRKHNSNYYGLTFTIISTGGFETQEDIKNIIQGSLLYTNSKRERGKLALV